MPISAAKESLTAFEQWNETISSLLDTAYNNSVVWLLMITLLGVGIWLTIRTSGMQVRMFTHMLKVITRSRGGSEGGVSSFQAFAIGLADRVGTGSITGVALAVVAGGPGSVFWMWVVALVGMATAFVEATLAQLFKVRNGDGTFRGGPAFYIQRGLGSRTWGIVFAVLLIFAYGFSFEMIQANSISQLANSDYLGFPVWATALILVLLTLPLVVGGVRKIAKFSEYLAPAMALLYVAMGILVIVLNYDRIPFVFREIFMGAFGQSNTYMPPAVAGAGGAFIAAITTGTKRGLFTNEAGMGSAPNAAAIATVRHPATQGMIQALGVFVDTMLVCTSTAFIILMSVPFWDKQNHVDGAVLTMDSIVTSLGSNSTTQTVVFVFVMVMMVCFGYSTILGNYTYAETNYKFIVGVDRSALPLKLLVIASTAIGAILPLKSVWSIADWATALMALVNLVALIFLGKWAVGALRDYRAQMNTDDPAGPVFCSQNNQYLPGELPTRVWTIPGGFDSAWSTSSATSEKENS
ncbi:amino acid carrier protein [uncultured Varibaculum sp.]|uniref:alanine/glycine:cation symporter family protein n=1 Tax=uncultured Varibaculum sp. TaxID=413896 RepID=UPI0027D971E6|nr:amino acid carrier protein [uncultured Varibaculum sp.]